MALMSLTRVRSTRNTCVRNVKSWATTAAVCNNHLYPEPESDFCATGCSSSIKAVHFLRAGFTSRFQTSLICTHRCPCPLRLPETSNIDCSSYPPSFCPSLQPPSVIMAPFLWQYWRLNPGMRGTAYLRISKCSLSEAKTCQNQCLFVLCAFKNHITPLIKVDVQRWISFFSGVTDSIGLNRLPHLGVCWLCVYRDLPSISLPRGERVVMWWTFNRGLSWWLYVYEACDVLPY